MKMICLVLGVILGMPSSHARAVEEVEGEWCERSLKEFMVPQLCAPQAGTAVRSAVSRDPEEAYRCALGQAYDALARAARRPLWEIINRMQVEEQHCYEKSNYVIASYARRTPNSGLYEMKLCKLYKMTVKVRYSP